VASQALDGIGLAELDGDELGFLAGETNLAPASLDRLQAAERAAGQLGVPAEPVYRLVQAGLPLDLEDLLLPDAISPVTIEADLRNRRVTTSVRGPAPKEGRARGRVGWMLRQLKRAPSDLRVEVSFARTSETTARLLPALREDPKSLLSAADPKRVPRAFDLALTRPMDKKRGRGRGSFIGDTREQGIEFSRHRPDQELAPARAAQRLA
jgi:hypothetical protein